MASIWGRNIALPGDSVLEWFQWGKWCLIDDSSSNSRGHYIATTAPPVNLWVNGVSGYENAYLLAIKASKSPFHRWFTFPQSKLWGISQLAMFDWWFSHSKLVYCRDQIPEMEVPPDHQYFRRIFHKKNHPAIEVPPCHHDYGKSPFPAACHVGFYEATLENAQIRCWVSAHCSAAQANPNFLSVRTAKERASWLGGFP